MNPSFQKALQNLRAKDLGAFRKRQEFSKILAGAWKDAMRSHGFGINAHGFPQMLGALKKHQPDIKTLSEEVERQLKFPAGALFGAGAGQIKGTATTSAA